MRRGWRDIEIWEASPKRFSLMLYYAEAADPTGVEVEGATRQIVAVVLKALLDAGKAPASDYIDVIASAVRPLHGVTGAERVANYGYASYDRASDSIEWSGCGSSWLNPC